jgi:hypothetical protein
MAHLVLEVPDCAQKFQWKGLFMKENMSDTEQKIRMAVGSAAGAAAVFAPLRYKWKAVLSAVAVTGLLTGILKVSPAKLLTGVVR